MITTRELAKLAGVCQSTVSRSLSGQAGVSEKKREEIVKLAKENGYFFEKQKDTRSDVKKRIIAFVVSDNFFKDYRDLYLDMLFNTIFDRIEKDGFFPALVVDHYKTVGLEKIEELGKLEGVAGCIITNREYNPAIDLYLQKVGIPHVYLHYFSKNSLENIDIVDTNHYLGGYLATRHLLELGHRKLLTITSTGKEFEDRTSGFSMALQEEGIKSAPIVFVGHTYEECYDYVSSHMEKIGKFTGIFVQNDMSALGCMNALQDKGLSVPEDISVVGYDDITVGQFCRPTLTTVKQPVDEIATAAVERLLLHISEENTKLSRVFVEPTLIVRNSTGPLHTKKKPI